MAGGKEGLGGRRKGRGWVGGGKDVGGWQEVRRGGWEEVRMGANGRRIRRAEE